MSRMLDAPKRPMSAYFLYLNDIRPQLVKEFPSVSVAEISKIAGERWRNIDQKTKNRYQQQHIQAKVEYDKDKADYEAKYGPIQPQKRRRSCNTEPAKRKI